jgi:hypothetical protein
MPITSTIVLNQLFKDNCTCLKMISRQQKSFENYAPPPPPKKKKISKEDHKPKFASKIQKKKKKKPLNTIALEAPIEHVIISVGKSTH